MKIMVVSSRLAEDDIFIARVVVIRMPLLPPEPQSAPPILVTRKDGIRAW